MREGDRDGKLVCFSYYGINWRQTRMWAMFSTDKTETIGLSLQPWAHLKPKIKSHSIASRKETMLPSMTLQYGLLIPPSHAMLWGVFSYYQ